MTVIKRSKVDIYSDILECICSEGGKIGRASPTRVARRANLPYDRFQKFLEHFIELKMVNQTEDGLQITAKGVDCLEQICQSKEFLRRMGLSI